MIDIFRDPSILEYEVDFTIIGHAGIEEEGKGSGVLREVLTSFWYECFSSLTVGALQKVPSVRHDYQKGEWEAIGRLIVYGYSFADESKVLEKALGNDLDPQDEDLLDLLSNFNCYKSPAKTNIFNIVHELAHQELVQKPRYIADCLAPIINRMRV